MNKYPFLFFLFFLFSCRNDRNKDTHSSTVMVCNKSLFVETYTIFGNGAYGGDRVSDYLTDSTNFRIYIGTYDNGDEGYSYECKGDSINVYKITGRRENKNKIISTTVYSLSELRKKKVFD